MKNLYQNPVELLRSLTFGLKTSRQVCEGIEGWQSDVRLGGFINAHDCTQDIQDLIYRTYFNVSWPSGHEMPVEEDADHAEKVKAFNKAAKKAATAAKKAGVPHVAQPFAQISYGAGDTGFMELGYRQLHASMIIKDVKVAVHFWGCPSPVYGWGGRHPYPFVPRIKIDSEEQLALFV